MQNVLFSVRPASDPSRKAGTGLRVAQLGTGGGNAA